MAVKVINHHEDEVMEIYAAPPAGRVARKTIDPSAPETSDRFFVDLCRCPPADHDDFHVARRIFVGLEAVDDPVAWRAVRGLVEVDLPAVGQIADQRMVGQAEPQMGMRFQAHEVAKRLQSRNSSEGRA